MALGAVPTMPALLPAEAHVINTLALFCLRQLRALSNSKAETRLLSPAEQIPPVGLIELKQSTTDISSPITLQQGMLGSEKQLEHDKSREYKGEG